MTWLRFFTIMGVITGKTDVFLRETDKGKQGGLYVHIRGYSGSGYGSRTGDYR